MEVTRAWRAEKYILYFPLILCRVEAVEPRQGTRDGCRAYIIPLGVPGRSWAVLGLCGALARVFGMDPGHGYIKARPGRVDQPGRVLLLFPISDSYIYLSFSLPPIIPPLPFPGARSCRNIAAPRRSMSAAPGR